MQLPQGVSAAQIEELFQTLDVFAEGSLNPKELKLALQLVSLLNARYDITFGILIPEKTLPMNLGRIVRMMHPGPSTAKKRLGWPQPIHPCSHAFVRDGFTCANSNRGDLLFLLFLLACSCSFCESVCFFRQRRYHQAEHDRAMNCAQGSSRHQKAMDGFNECRTRQQKFSPQAFKDLLTFRPTLSHHRSCLSCQFPTKSRRAYD